MWAEYLPLFQAGIPIIAGLVNLDAIVKEPKIAFVGFPSRCRSPTARRYAPPRWCTDAPRADLSRRPRAPAFSAARSCACDRRLGIALVSAAAVVGADLLMHSSLLRLLRPQILAPADGAIVSGPVTVSWEGPAPMQAALTGNGQRIELGLRENPFEIDPSRFPRPGQYGLELTNPRFGRLISADRRFMVRRATAARVNAAAGAPAAARRRAAAGARRRHRRR